jgi:predicted glycosyltransferase
MNSRPPGNGRRRPANTAPPRPVWIDLANSPHVLFFQPVIAELHRRGVPTVVSARDFAQTVDLCRLLGIEAEVIGTHGGAGLAGKAGNLVGRVRALRVFARSKAPAVAVSHNSYAQALAGRSLGVPVVTAMDYEFQPANHLAFRCASLVAVPDVYPLDALRRQGAKLSKVWRYSGLKEEIALAGFVPEPGYLQQAGILPPAATPPVVVVRPPADMALYHRFDNPLFAQLLAALLELRRSGKACVVLLARTKAQAASLEREGFADLMWGGAALDGRRLIAAADAVVSAGGSMNREAAVLGTPAYSIYAGKLAAVDRALVADGRLKLLLSPADIAGMAFCKKPAVPSSGGTARAAVDDRLLLQFVDRLLQTADGV